MYKYELHAHTSECDLVARLSGAELVRAYARRGYSGMVITDHYFSIFFDWFREELEGKPHRRIIDRWLRGYESARNEGEKIGFTVLPGAEVRIDGTINDYLVYGLEIQDLYHLPLLNRMASIDEVLDILPESTCVVHAHPFRENMTVRDPGRFFGIEVHNGGTDSFRNALAKTWAAHYGKAMTSGSDCHGPWAVGQGGIITETPIFTPADLVKTLRGGAYQLIEPEKEEKL